MIALLGLHLETLLLLFHASGLRLLEIDEVPHGFDQGFPLLVDCLFDVAWSRNLSGFLSLAGHLTIYHSVMRSLAQQPVFHGRGHARGNLLIGHICGVGLLRRIQTSIRALQELAEMLMALLRHHWDSWSEMMIITLVCFLPCRTLHLLRKKPVLGTDGLSLHIIQRNTLDNVEDALGLDLRLFGLVPACAQHWQRAILILLNVYVLPWHL